jgi:hypothetical protein
MSAPERIRCHYDYDPDGVEYVRNQKISEWLAGKEAALAAARREARDAALEEALAAVEASEAGYDAPRFAAVGYDPRPAMVYGWAKAAIRALRSKPEGGA